MPEEILTDIINQSQDPPLDVSSVLGEPQGKPKVVGATQDVIDVLGEPEQVQPEEIPDIELDDEERGALLQGMAEEEPVREGTTTTIPEEKPSVGRVIYEGLARGSASLTSGISRIPAFIYTLAAMPQNIIGEALNIQKLKVKPPEWLINHPVAKYYDKQVEAWNASDEKYDKLITGYLKNGEVGNALGLLAANTAETLPLMVGLYMGGFAGVTSTQTLTGMSLYSGAEKMKEIEDVDLPEYMKTFNAITTGLAEGAFETIGTFQIAKLGKEVFLKAGAKEGKKILKEGFETTFKRAFKKMYGTAAPVAEGLEEAATTFTQNLTDRYTGVDPERNPMEGIGDSFLIGMTASGAMTAPIKVATKIKEKQIKAAEAKEELKKEPEKVEKAPEKPVEEVSPEKKGVVPEKKEKVLEKPTEKKEAKPKAEVGEEIPDNIEYNKGRKEAAEGLLETVKETRERFTGEEGEKVLFDQKAKRWRKEIIGEQSKDMRGKEYDQEYVTKEELDVFEKKTKEDLIKTEQKLKELKGVEDAIQEPKTEKVPVDEQAKPSEKVDEEVREPDIKKETTEEAGEEKLDIRKSVGAAIEGFSKKAAKELKNLGVLFSGGKFTKKIKPEGKIKFGIQKKTPKQEKRRVDIIRSVLKDTIKDNEAVLKRIHGRTVPAIMRKLENSITVRSMNRAIDYIEKVVSEKKAREEFIRKENGLADIEKRVEKKTYLVKGRKQNRIKYPDSKVFEAMVDRISGRRWKEGIKDIIKNKDPEKALKEMKGLEVQLENPELTEGERIELQNRIQDLGFLGLYDMSAKQIEGKLSELKDIVKGATAEGIAANEARIEADVKEYDWYVDISAKKAFKKGEVVSKEEPMTDQTKINKLPEKYRRWYNPFGIFMNNIPVVLDKMSRYDPKRGETFDNQMSRRIMPKIQDGMVSYAESTETSNKMIESKRKEIFKPKNDKDMRRILKNNAVALKTPFKEKIKSRLGLTDRALTEKVEFKNEETGEMDYLDLNQNVAAKYWMMLQDPSLDKTFFSEITHDRRGLQKGMGWSDSYVKVIENYMTPEMKKWSEYLLNEYYPWVYEVVNKTYRKINGTDLNYTEFYTNITREGAGKPPSIEETMAGESMISTVNNGSLLNRTGSTLPLRGEDVNRSMLAYTEKMLYYASWAEPVRYLQKIFRNPRIKNAIKQWGTRDPLDHMNRLTDMLANRRERQVIGHKLVNEIRKRFIIGTIGMKGTVYIKQLFSQPAYLVSLGVKNTTRAVAEFIANPKKAWDITMENPEARRRIKGAGGDADVVYAMQKDFRKGGGTKDWVSFFMTNVRYGDIAPIVVGYPKLYKIEYNKAKESMPTEDAKKHAQKVAWNNVNMWQQSSETAYLSPLQLENAYAKLFTMYMTAPLSYHRQATRSLANLAGDIKRGRLKTSGGRKIIRNHIKRFIVAHVVLPQLFTYAMNGLQWEDDEQLRALFVGSINNLPFIGDALDYALDYWQGKPFDYAPTPTSSVVKYSVRLIKMIGKMMEEENDNVSVEDILDVAADVASTTTGIPVTGVHNTVSGAADILKGETQYPFRRLAGFSEYELQEGAEKKEEKKGGKTRAR